MFKRYLISLTAIALMAMSVSHSYAVPIDNDDQVMDINHWIQSFWQLGDSFTPLYKGWGCDKYAGKGTVNPCKDENDVFLDGTIGKHGCALTALQMLYWAYGMQWVPDNTFHKPQYTDILHPGRFDDWMVDNNAYYGSKVHYYKTTTKFYYTGIFASTFWTNYTETRHIYLVPNFCCVPGCTKKQGTSDSCFVVKKSDPNFDYLLDSDTKGYYPDLMKIKWKKPTDTAWTHLNHLVVVGGYDKANSEYRDYDPGQHKYPGRGFNEIYGKDNYEFDTLYRFHALATPKTLDENALYLGIFSPVEVQIIDPKGRRTGYDPATGTKLQENPMSMYYEDSAINSLYGDEQAETIKKLDILEAAEGNYILKIFGTGEGPYTIKMQGVQANGDVNLDTSITGTATSSLSETYRITYSPTGEAALSNTNQPPIAIAGANQTGEQSYEIALDGSGSSDPDGDPITYTWSFVSKPVGSAATLSNANAVNPTFTPDLLGTYVLRLVVNDYFTDSAPSTVTITATPIQSHITVTPNFSTALSAGSGFISFDVNNIGRIGVSLGVIDMTLKDPDGNIISTGSRAFSLSIGQSATVSVPVSIPSLKFGNYTLTYTQSDETSTGSPATVTIANSATASFAFDKTSYKIRETANLALNLSNIGKLNLENTTVTVSVPDAGYSDTRTVSLGVNPNATAVNMAIPLPATMTAGQHSVNVNLALPSGSTITQSAKLTVPASSLTINYFGPLTASAGDILHYTIENSGGVDTSYITETFLLKDSRGITIYEGNVTGSILAGEIKTLADVQLPTNVVTGTVSFNIRIKDAKTGNLASFSSPLQIAGLTSGLQTRTDKIVYVKTEAITGITNIVNGAVGIDDGSLKIVVSKMKASGTGQFEHFLPEEWRPFIMPDSVAIASDGSVYVVDYDNYYDYGRKRIQRFDGNFHLITKWKIDYTLYGIYRDNYHANISDIAIGPDGAVYVVDGWNLFILKFDSNGNFITKWGSYGTGDGQFSWPEAIAVSSDNFVYVADYNNNIQKFDSNGNFITRWGSYGTGNGQFRVPESVEVGPDGSVYVLDYANNRVQKFDANGNFITKWGSYGNGDGQFNYPRGEIAIDSNGFVYVSDPDNYRVQKFDANGNFIIKWGGYGSCDGRFRFPDGVGVTSNGLVYVSDRLDYSIKKFDSNGNFISKGSGYGACPGEFNQPSGVAAADGSFYVADTWNSRVQKFDKDKNFVITWGTYGSNNGQFNNPYGIAVGPDNSVYVDDTYNNRIQKFDSNGNFINKWGSYGSGDGQFSYPYGLAVGQDGSVYVADTYNYRVQKFDSDGNFITKWGAYGSNDGEFYFLRGIAVSPSGFVYVADSSNYRIQKFDLNGNFIGKWGTWGSGDGQFLAPPYGIAIGPDGSVLVTSEGDQGYNQKIQQFDSDGNFIKKWTGYGSGDGEFNHLRGITAASDGSVYVADAYNNRIQRMVPLTAGSERLFETMLPVVQSANTAQEYTTAIGMLNTTGRLYLNAELKNGLGQTIGMSEYPFYVVEGDTILLFNTDKKVYKPGETVTLTGEVQNLAAIEAPNLRTEIRTLEADKTHVIYSETFSLPAGGNHPFTVRTIAGSEGTVTLTGTVSQNNAGLVENVDLYQVATPKLTYSVTAPSVVGNEPFTLNLELKNEGKADAVVGIQLSNNRGQTETRETTVPAGETKLVQYSRQITRTTNFTFTFSRDLNWTVSKIVAYGLAANIEFGVQSAELGVYPEGKVSVPVTITNIGQMDETLLVGYSLSSQGSVVSSQDKNYFIPKGASTTDTLYYDLAEGAYQLMAHSSLPTADANVNFFVLKENKVNMSTTAGSQGANGLIPVTMTLVNNGYNAINGSIALAVMNNDAKAVWRGEAEVAGLASQTSANYIINVDASGIVPGLYKADVVLYSASGHQLAMNQAQIRTEGPIFEITSMPNNPTFTVGRQGTLSFTVKNTGTLSGSANLKVAAMDVLNQSTTDTFSAGEEKSYAFSFTLPEDTAEQDYPADYALTSALSQGTKGQTQFHVAQVKVGMTAALDKEAYKNGETAVLTLSITKQSATEDGTYVAIIRYGAHHDMQPFTLSAQPATLTFNVPLEVITGQNLFYGVHFESGMAISRNSIFINEARPDLAATIEGQMTDEGVLTPEVRKDNTVQITATVANYGKTASEATTAVLYDGDEIIDIKSVRALNPGESEAMTVFWNVLGKAGERILSIVVDPQDVVTEYSEENNLTYRNVLIPDIALFTETDKETYKIRQKVYITSLITNLTATTPFNDLTLGTTAKDPAGSVVFSKNTAIGPIPASSSTNNAEIWSTSGLPVDGTYTVTQTVSSGSQLIAQNSKLVTLQAAPDFTLSTDETSRKIKQGEQATYTASIEPIQGWNHEVTMSIDGLPVGTTVTFNPDKLIPPGQSQTIVITTDTTAIGTHTLYLTAQGTDEGEIVLHTVPLTLDVSGYGLETTASEQTIKQLETASFPINLTSLNGYEGSVSLSITGLPYGTKATLDNSHLGAPGTATLTVVTSKYAKPGTYSLMITGDDGLATHNLNLNLVLQPNPDIAAGIIATPGPGPQNEAVVRIYGANLVLTKEFTVFTTKYGVSAITADINGDGYDEIIVAQGPDTKNTATFRVLRRDGTPFIEHTAFDTKYGLTLASGDIDGDWSDEIIVGMGPDPKNPGTIKILKYTNAGFTEVMNKTVYPDTGYGINIATGDVDGDGIPEIITAPGPGPNNPASVTIWQYSDTGLTEIKTFPAFDGTYGANITTGDIDNDGKTEIITGTGPDPKNSALVRIYNQNGEMQKELAAYDDKHAYGVNVTSADLDNDGFAELITGTGPGPQNEALMKIFSFSGKETDSFNAYPDSVKYGVRVSGGRTGM